MKITKSFFVEPENASGLVAESFGIGAGWENKILDIDIPDVLPDVVFITGESGCGKTTLLKELGKTTSLKIPNKPLHQWAATDEESLQLLSSVGLNDASLFCLHYESLSDSQQARARLYAALASKVKTLVVDEFFSTLDRETAMALAYSFQKTIRREGIKLLVASAHTDLIDYLRPDLLVNGLAFPSRWAVSSPVMLSTNPIVDNVSFVFYKDKVTGRVLSETGKSIGYAPGCIVDGKMKYRECELATLHYKGKYLGGASEYLFAYYKGRQIGVLVGAKTRHYNKDKGMSIARVVVHPSYRGCGVGKRIIQEFLHHHLADPVETTAAMARFNPVFERAGMVRVKDTEIKPPASLIKDFHDVPYTSWCSREKCEALFSNEARRVVLSKHAELLSSMYDKGGMREVYKQKHATMMPQTEITKRTKKAILEDYEVAARLFWRLRPHTMARYTKPS